MITLFAGFLLPAAELATTYWIFRRTRKYPILLAYLLTEGLWCAYACYDYRHAIEVSLIPRMIARAVVALDVTRRTLGPLVKPHRAAIGCFAAVFCGLATAATYAHTHLTPWQSLYAFRQYYHLLLAAALWAIVYGTRCRLSVANAEIRAYRLGIAWMMTTLAVGGMFVKGGLGYMLLPYTRETWMAVSIGGYLALTAVAVYLALGIGGWRRVPAVAARVRRLQVVRAA